jgi:hypothetical protein
MKIGDPDSPLWLPETQNPEPLNPEPDTFIFEKEDG